MKDAVGGSVLLNLVIIFSSVVILVFVGLMSYVKAYRVKNKIIEVIEKYDGYDATTSNALTSDLGRAGYITATNDKIRQKCDSGSLTITNSFVPGYLYCVYEKNTNDGKLYQVVTYINFNFPVINELLTFEVRGETKILGKNYNY